MVVKIKGAAYKDEKWLKKHFAKYLNECDITVIDEFDGLNGSVVWPIDQIANEYPVQWADFAVLEGVELHHG